MTISRTLASASATVAVTALLALSGCATDAGSSPAPTSAPAGLPSSPPVVAPPEGPVTAAGMVIDAAGDVEICLGGVMESYPPQCVGVPVDGWTWDQVDGSESIGEVRWGSYAIRGAYDGERFALTDPPTLLALYDPMPIEDPTRGVPGTSTDRELSLVQDEVFPWLGADALTAGPERGYVWVQVVWDDGTLQDAVDTAYGKGVVIVTSAIRTAG
ncbi:hypothetical protein [uncultured Microbacterium sp.]|uniref:hypothetical protein n=1 Tax=uncultured Microbacterium sp. TaxID=191216 RepID=UPI0028D0F7D8|nr:hypothetical protein [uncultured Microbacterium sp.]